MVCTVPCECCLTVLINKYRLYYCEVVNQLMRALCMCVNTLSTRCIISAWFVNCCDAFVALLSTNVEHRFTFLIKRVSVFGSMPKLMLSLSVLHRMICNVLIATLNHTRLNAAFVLHDAVIAHCCCNSSIRLWHYSWSSWIFNSNFIS